MPTTAKPAVIGPRVGPSAPSGQPTRQDGLIFININEEGEEYNRHNNLDDALKVLREFPNDHIVVKYSAG